MTSYASLTIFHVVFNFQATVPDQEYEFALTYKIDQNGLKQNTSA